jgi:MtfA peptidase
MKFLTKLFRRTPDQLPGDLWTSLSRHVPLIASLQPDEQDKLRALTKSFLDDKAIVGAAGFEPNGAQRLAIAAQASIPVIHLGYDWLDGFKEVIVYPGEFNVRHEGRDENGLVVEGDQARLGEAWERGPMVLAWSEIEEDIVDPHSGSNVVIHEIAHKLDMQNGRANGMPPLHKGMSWHTWTQAMQQAFDDMNMRLSRNWPTEIDAYGASAPEEFFAVATESYFSAPAALKNAYPDVFSQLDQFYRPPAKH